MKRRIFSLTLCLLLTLTLWVPAQAASDTTYQSYLTAALNKLLETTPDPACGTKKGEWVVLSIARSGAEEEAWYGKYLDNLCTYVDSKNGALHGVQNNYTEYSRVILGLSSIGQDAAALNTGSQVYDLVTPLLERRTDGEYWASWQSNPSRAFAIIALDSQNYLDNATGKAARAEYMNAILRDQMSDGSWGIYPDDESGDIDSTAMILQALAPYYLNQTRYDALGASYNYSRLQSAVSNALNFLKKKKSGNYGFVESAAQVVVALAALNRDAAQDSLLGDALSSVLAYHLSGGGFAHAKGEDYNQMATEQAAYALVAYDRWKNGKTSLYDMSDRGKVSAIAFNASPTATVNQIATGSFTVTCTQACVVISRRADGTYYRLTAEGTGNTRTFHTVQSQITVRLLGDYDNNGEVETLDLAKANKALLGSGVNGMKALIMGVENGCALETVDLAKLNRKIVLGITFDW